MPYAISRIAKLKQSNIGGSGMHVSRTRVTLNADPNKLSENQTLIHNNDRDLPLSEVVHNKIHSVHQNRKIRTDAVYAVEILLTASPEYFRPDDPSKYGEYQQDKLDGWMAASQKWLKDEYGDRIVRAELHLDEATPHIHAYLVPVDAQGQLNCKKIFGGRAKMFAFQDSYAAATKHLGLERGVKESIAEHTTVKEYYEIVNAASGALDLDNLQVLKTKAAAYESMKREKDQLEKRVKLLAEQRDRVAVELKNIQASILAKLEIDRAMAAQTPLISIAQVAIELQVDSRTLSPSVGIIDLVAATCKTNLGGALSWLNEKFGAAATAQLLTHAAQKISHLPQHQFIAPGSVKSEWGDVRKYLTEAKSLPAKLVDRLYDDRLIYAGEDGKLICLHRDFNGGTTGATAIDLKDEQPQKLLVEGSSLTTGFHYFERDPFVDTERVVICDDPIEAMAYATLHLPARPTLYLSAHDGGFVPGNKLSAIEIIVACDIELQNLPARFDRHLPIEDSWMNDLKSELASLTSGQIQIGERDDRQIRVIQEIQQELLDSAQQHNRHKNPPLDRNRGGR
jgi:chaperonin cofactor prefoldin